MNNFGRNILSICNTGFHHRHFKTTPSFFLNQKFRRERGLPLNPNASGVLIETPDYSYLDGRLTPFGAGQKKRYLKQQDVRQQIIGLSKEVDFAVERYKGIQVEEARRKKQIMDGKLKPKGKYLLKSD